MADSLWDIYIKFCIDIYTYKPIKMLYLPLIYKSLTTCISFHHWQWTNNFVSAESALIQKKKKKKAGPDGCLLELDYFPCCKVVCLWFMCFLLLRCFSCSHTVLPKEHSLGVIFFLLTFLMLCCIFLQFPVFLSCLPPCHICMLCMYGQVDG